jgi:hypothetical protein
VVKDAGAMMVDNTPMLEIDLPAAVAVVEGKL